jgi:molybdate transport system substrate-binding protein
MKLKIFIPAILVLSVFSCSTTRTGISSSVPANSGLPTDSFTLGVLCAVGMRQVMLDLLPKFEQVTGYVVAISFNSSGEIVKSVDSGKTVDLVIIHRSAFERIVATKRVMASSITDIATSSIGVAVNKGAPKPDISSTEAFKKAILNAKSIACPDPAREGASGMYIAALFERLGIAEALKSKLVLSSIPENENAMPGYLVATGKAEIALHQMQELLAVPGIDIVGPLPEEIQATFLFAAGVIINSKKANKAKALIQFLGTADAKAIIKMKGMEPAGH